MQFFYNLSVYIVGFFLQFLALFHTKMGLFVKGRKHVFTDLEKNISNSDKVIWIHCASLGEFEQGRPIIEELKKTYDQYKVVLTFFSPSGYEVQKKYEHADVVVYLPLDTKKNAKKFLSIINPSVAVFVKYEFWPNYLSQLKKMSVPTILVSGIFRKDQVFFKVYGGWMRSKLNGFSHFFLQDLDSEKLLKSIGFSNTTVCGDTRFDRVYDILSRDNELDYISEFCGDSYVLVAGSSWPEDEDLLVEYILNVASEEEKFIIAPHNIKPVGIKRLKDLLGEHAVLFSQREGKELASFKVFVVDTIGILTKIYSKASVAYVGGGYTKSGIHNVLEPATFGVPVVIGPNFKKFREAKDLISLGGCITTNSQHSVNEVLSQLKVDVQFRKEKGTIALDYIKASLGATNKICTFIESVVK